jgi:hypothetical protein
MNWRRRPHPAIAGVLWPITTGVRYDRDGLMGYARRAPPQG